MSWFSQQWRTQRNAILKVNCRILWIFMFLNACCASENSWKHACLSVCSPHSRFVLFGKWFADSGPSHRLLSVRRPKWRDDGNSFKLWTSAPCNQRGALLRQYKILVTLAALARSELLRIVRSVGTPYRVPTTQLSDLKSGKRTRWI